MKESNPTFMVLRIGFKPWILVRVEGYVLKLVFVIPASFGLGFMHRLNLLAP